MIRRWLLLGVLLLLSLAACQEGAEDNPDGPEADSIQTFNVATASGRVLPAERATLSFAMSGRLNWVAAPGTRVAAGETLALLDSVALEAALTGARAGLKAAQAQFSLATTAPSPETVAGAEAALAVAAGNLRLAQAEAAGAQSEADAALALAQAELDRAQAGLQLAEAERDLTLERFAADEPEAAAAEAQVALAAATMAAAQIALDRAEDSEPQLAAISAREALAQGQLDQAQAALERLQNGPDELEMAALTAQVDQAAALVRSAEAALAEATLVAPFAGEVALVSYRPGELVLPGQPILQLGDQSQLQVETTDLDEVDLVQLTVGQPAFVTFDAFPGSVTEGVINSIASANAPGLGGATYTVVVALSDVPAGLRWGMTAFVDIELD